MFCPLHTLTKFHLRSFLFCMLIVYNFLILSLSLPCIPSYLSISFSSSELALFLFI